MPPIEIELKDGWAAGLNAVQKRKVVQPGEKLEFQPHHSC